LSIIVESGLLGPIASKIVTLHQAAQAVCVVLCLACYYILKTRREARRWSLIAWIFEDIWIYLSEAFILIMAGYPYTSHQFICNEPKVQFANALPMSNVNGYFASTINPYVDVARFDNSRHIASASTYLDGVNYANYNSEFYIQKPLSNNMHALSFNDTSNIQHFTHTPTVQQVQTSVNMYQRQTTMVSSANYYGTPHTSNFTNIQQSVSSIYSSAGNLQYVITSQNLPVNEKVGYVNFSHLTSYSQTSCATNLYNIQQGRDESVLSI
jgi:hypothetical protein